MYLGSHISIRKGFLHAAKTAFHIGATAFQYFPKNPRSLSIKSLDKKDAEACAAFCNQHDIQSIAHTPYPTNLAVDENIHKKLIIDSILNDLLIAEACGSIGVVVHFGKYKGKDTLQGYKNSLQCLNDVLSRWFGRALLLIENQAGEGSLFGTTLEEAVRIRELSLFPEKIGFCFDTCHAFVSGLWKEGNWLKIAEKADKLGYFKQLYAVHLNDSVYPSGSRRDRHANVGKGYIGIERMQLFLNTPTLPNVPFILETPSGLDGSHRLELDDVKKLLN